MRKLGYLAAVGLLLLLCACGARQTAQPTGAGYYVGRQICLPDGSWQPIEEVYEAKTALQLDATGSGVFWVDGEATDITWETEDSRLQISLGQTHCEGTLDAGKIELPFFDTGILLRLSTADTDWDLPESFDPDSAAEPSPTDYSAYWAGDWYGWHVITAASDNLSYLVDNAWDACAHISVNGESGTLTVWDTENEPDELLCRVSVAFSPGATDAGCMSAVSGTYLGCEITDGWQCDPGRSEVQHFAHMICIIGRAEDDQGGWVRYRLYLRPWGMSWDDVRTGDTSGCLYGNMLPPEYESWYAPLLRQGADMPETFED